MKEGTVAAGRHQAISRLKNSTRLRHRRFPVLSTRANRNVFGHVALTTNYVATEYFISACPDEVQFDTPRINYLSTLPLDWSIHIREI